MLLHCLKELIGNQDHHQEVMKADFYAIFATMKRLENTKLFLLSLLWRAGISTREEYKEVDLGMYSEIIRKQIFENKTSEDNNIQITIYKFEEGSNYSSFIGQPRRHKFGHSTAYSMVITGYLIVYHLRENDISKKAYNNRLKENNIVAIIEVPKNKVEKFVMKYTGMI